jgi:hypothetical protein
MIGNYRIRLKIRKLDLSNCIVYVTHPRIFASLKGKNIGILVYDCMDDAVYMTKRFKRYVLKLESELIRSSTIIICSSTALQTYILSKYQKQSTLIENSVKLNKLSEFTKRNSDPLYKKAIFFGVIGEWIDQDFLIKIKGVRGFHLELYGPVTVSLRSELKSCYKGVLPQRELYKVANKCDVALLPYLKNDFTKTINPCKIYEYIGLRLPVIATNLNSLDNFKDLFVPYDEFSEPEKLINKALDIYPKHDERRELFLENNDWRARALEITTLIKGEILNK